MSGDGEEDLSAFVALHGAALRASGIPALYWESLCRKLRGEVGDRGSLGGMALREALSLGPRVFPAEGASSVRRRWRSSLSQVGPPLSAG